MTVYGRAIDQETMNNIATYMDDEIREELHRHLAPCTPKEFLEAYLERDPDFEELLKREFDFCREGE